VLGTGNKRYPKILPFQALQNLLPPYLNLASAFWPTPKTIPFIRWERKTHQEGLNSSTKAMLTNSLSLGIRFPMIFIQSVVVAVC